LPTVDISGTVILVYDTQMAGIGKKQQISVLGTMFIFFCKFVVAFQQFYFDISFIWKLLVF